MNKIVLGKVMMIAKGNYSDNQQYEKLDFVMYNGSSYVAKQSTIGNVPTNEDYWQLLSAKGDTGPQGIQGEKGEKGDTGPQGIQGPQGEKGDSYILTDNDKQDIAKIVLNLLPSSEGVDY